MPGTFVSKVSFTSGVRSVCSALPNARLKAEVGQTSMHFALPTQRSGWARIALPLTSASVPVSGQAYTQPPHPMQRVALMTGRGLPRPAPSAPGCWMVARCRFHSDIGAPQFEQNVESREMDFPQRGHSMLAGFV